MTYNILDGIIREELANGIRQWYDQYQSKWRYILIGIHITINSIAMKMGEDMYSTIYSWKIYMGSIPC